MRTISTLASVVGQNIDTFIGNARIHGDFPAALAEQLEDLKRRSQGTEEVIPTPWQFAGEVVFIKPHGAGRQWRWILHSPSLHLDVGLGRLTHIVAKARLSSAFLWEHEIGIVLTLLYGFLAEFLRVPFITRSRSKGLRLFPLVDEHGSMRSQGRCRGVWLVVGRIYAMRGPGERVSIPVGGQFAIAQARGVACRIASAWQKRQWLATWRMRVRCWRLMARVTAVAIWVRACATTHHTVSTMMRRQRQTATSAHQQRWTLTADDVNALGVVFAVKA